MRLPILGLSAAYLCIIQRLLSTCCLSELQAPHGGVTPTPKETPPRPKMDMLSVETVRQENTPITLDSFYPKMLLSHDAVSSPLLSRKLPLSHPPVTCDPAPPLDPSLAA